MSDTKDTDRSKLGIPVESLTTEDYILSRDGNVVVLRPVFRGPGGPNAAPPEEALPDREDDPHAA